MGQLTTLRNGTGVPQSIVFKGRQIIIGANMEQTFDSEVAESFIKNRSPLVTKVEEAPDLFDDGLSDRVWLANFTGSTEAPDTISSKHWANGRWVVGEVPNPLKKPIVIRRRMGGGTKQFTAKDGALEMRNLAATPFVLPVGARRLFPKALATWALRRDSQSETQGSLIKSRAPSNFEPDMQWDLDDIRGYFRLIDPSAKVGPSEVDVATKAAQNPEAVRAGASGIQAYIDDAKRDILQRLFFRIADPQYYLPKREEFNEFMHGEPITERSDADAVMDMLTGSAEEVKKIRRKTRSDKGKKRVRPEMVSATP